ncbi:MAG: tetratricopeptide repeat protein [Gammaproteobacteria bacterium]
MRKFLIIFVLLLVACGPQRIEMPELPVVPMEGLNEAVKEHLETALTDVRAAQNDAEANGKLAMTLHAYNLNEAAEIAYRRARSLEPKEFQWHYLHAVVLQTLAQNDKALTEYKQASKLRDEYPPLQLRTATLLAETGNVDASLNIFSVLEKAAPGFAAAHFGHGQVLAQNGDSKSAMGAFRKAIKLEPKYGAAHYALATLLRNAGDSALAAEHFALFERNRDFLAKTQDALLSEVKALNVSESRLFNNALKLLKERKSHKAIQAFEQVLENNPENYSALINLVGLYGDINNPQEAERYYEAARLVKPDIPKLYNNIGSVRLRNKRFKEAEEAFSEAVRIDPEYAIGWRNLGRALEDQGNDSDALKHYKRALEADETNRQALFFYGNLLLKLDRPDEAVAPLTKSLEPNDSLTPHYLKVLAAAQLETGDVRSAGRSLQRAVALAKRTGQKQLQRETESQLERLRSMAPGAF